MNSIKAENVFIFGRGCIGLVPMTDDDVKCHAVISADIPTRRGVIFSNNSVRPYFGRMASGLIYCAE